MVKIAIRDDDLNYFSKVEDIEKVYKPLGSFPVSFAVIPSVTDVSTIGACPETKGNTIPAWIGDNKELSSWLRSGLNAGSLDVLMHGITHGYKCINEKRLPEMVWRVEDNLANQIGDYKKKLEILLDHTITVFVAPSNMISKYGIACVAKNNMNFSGIVPVTFQREVTIQNVYSWLKRIRLRVTKGIPYPGVLEYSDHLELNACVMQGYDYLVKLYNYCETKGLPMAINVHYWHMRDNVDYYEGFYKFINYALEHGAQPATVTSIISEYSVNK